MKVSRLKNSISYLFLVLFLSMKLVGLHALSHSDDKDHALHCEICDRAIVNNLTAALSPDSQDFLIENLAVVLKKEIAQDYSFITSSTIASNQLFSRPPPSL